MGEDSLAPWRDFLSSTESDDLLVEVLSSWVSLVIGRSSVSCFALFMIWLLVEGSGGLSLPSFFKACFSNQLLLLFLSLTSISGLMFLIQYNWSSAFNKIKSRCFSHNNLLLLKLLLFFLGNRLQLRWAYSQIFGNHKLDRQKLQKAQERKLFLSQKN